jgi:hypothetical protein
VPYTRFGYHRTRSGHAGGQRQARLAQQRPTNSCSAPTLLDLAARPPGDFTRPTVFANLPARPRARRRARSIEDAIVQVVFNNLIGNNALDLHRGLDPLEADALAPARSTPLLAGVPLRMVCVSLESADRHFSRMRPLPRGRQLHPSRLGAPRVVAIVGPRRFRRRGRRPHPRQAINTERERRPQTRWRASRLLAQGALAGGPLMMPCGEAR